VTTVQTRSLVIRKNETRLGILKLVYNKNFVEIFFPTSDSNLEKILKAYKLHSCYKQNATDGGIILETLPISNIISNIAKVLRSYGYILVTGS